MQRQPICGYLKNLSCNLGYLYTYELKDYVKGEQYYLMAKENNPINIQYYRDLATIYRLIEQPAKEEAILLEAKQKMPANLDVYTMLGEYYKENNNITEALAAYQQALKLEPNNEAIRQEVARLQSLLR